jgi:hypothetical protein
MTGEQLNGIRLAFIKQVRRLLEERGGRLVSQAFICDWVELRGGHAYGAIWIVTIRIDSPHWCAVYPSLSPANAHDVARLLLKPQSRSAVHA